jgi:glutamate/tyrosine decarboxylase-like PLP-dependent enzyme
MARRIPSPLNIGIENSRRFRALPVYSTLAAYGRQGYREILIRQIELARAIARFILSEPRLQLLPEKRRAEHYDPIKEIYIVVLFRAKEKAVNTNLVQQINATREIYVSGTLWDNQPAARFAVSNWQVDIERDIALIKKVLLAVLQSSP